MADNPRPMAVLQVCSASTAVYGAVHSMMTLAGAQRERGWRVEFLTRKGKRFGEEVSALGYPVHEIAIHTKIDPVAVLKMCRLIRRGKFDVVHTHLSTSTVNGTLAARFARVPCVATVHGLSGKLSFLAADHLIAVSDSTKDHLVAQGIPESRITVVYNGVRAPDRIPGQAEARAKLGLNGCGPILGTVARITEEKGIEHALVAVSKLTTEFPNLRYLVVGDGDGLEACRTLAAQLGIEERVEFAGYRERPDEYVAAFDLMLFPSLQEAMGLAAVEAFLAGVPVVGSDTGGIPEVVTPDAGALVPPGDPEALAAKTAELLRSPETLAAMSRAARVRAREVFGADAMADRTEEVYRALIARQRR